MNKITAHRKNAALCGVVYPKVISTYQATVRCAASNTGFHTVTASYNIHGDLARLDCDCDNGEPGKIDAARIMSAIVERSVPLCGDLKQCMVAALERSRDAAFNFTSWYPTTLANMNGRRVEPASYAFGQLPHKLRRQVIEDRECLLRCLMLEHPDEARRGQARPNTAFSDAFGQFLYCSEVDAAAEAEKRQREADKRVSGQTLLTQRLERMSGTESVGLVFRTHDGKLVLEFIRGERSRVATYRGLGCWDFDSAMDSAVAYNALHGTVWESAERHEPDEGKWLCPCCSQATNRPKQHVHKSKKHVANMKRKALQVLATASDHLCRHG